MTKKTIFLISLLILLSGKSIAQDNPGKTKTDTITKTVDLSFLAGKIISLNANTLNEVIISNYHINDSLLNAPAAIGILSSAQLQRNNNSDISASLNTLSGVYMQSGGLNTNRISIRGIGARTPYGTNKIRAFYGSIPLRSGDSETTIEDIDLEIVNQIEVIKGPLSSLYGAGLGGAILLTPKQSAYHSSRAAISTTIGSYGLNKNTISYGFDTKNGSLNLSYHKLETDGWRDNSNYKREGVTLAGEIFRKENSKLTYFGNYTYMKAYIPSSINKETFDNNPGAAAPTWAASKGYEQYDSYLGGLAYDWKARDWLKNSTSVFINAKDSYEPRPFDILTQDNIAWGGRTQFFGDVKIGNIKTEFIAGLEYFNDGFDGGTYENLYQDNNGNGTLQGAQLTGSKQRRDFINAFAQLRLQLARKWEIQTGVNYNKTQFELDTTYPTDITSSQDYSYKGTWLPQLSLLFKPSSLQTVYISASRGFSLPAIEETLTADGTINPNIKPENGYNFEVGGKFYFLTKNLYAEISLYHMQINDLLVAQRVGDDQYIGVNAGETLHQGIEANINYRWDIEQILRVSPYVTASIGKYEFKEFLNNGIDYSGNELTGVPSNKINAGIMIEKKGFYLSSDLYYADKTPMNDANSAYADSYSLLNAKAGYRFELFKGLSSHISAGVNNIANTHYASMVLVNAVGTNGAAPRYYYPGLPVNYYGNVAFSYSF